MFKTIFFFKLQVFNMFIMGLKCANFLLMIKNAYLIKHSGYNFIL